MLLETFLRHSPRIIMIWLLSELINTIEINIDIVDIFGTIAIVKGISQLLLLLLITSSITIEFFSCLEYAVSKLLQWA